MTHAKVHFGTYEGDAPRYTGIATQSLYITMRDGIKIAVDVVLPRDLPSGTRIPALIQQTRYWRAMELRAPFRWFLKPEALDADFAGFQPFFTSRGYALVLVDCRGTGASFGSWLYPWADDSVEDAREIVDWVVSQPWSNGKVAGMGMSYVGTTAELLLVPNHPAVEAVVPMFNHPDAYVDIAFPGGVLNRRFMHDWGHFDHVLDQNRVPREFGLLAPLVVKGVKPVDGQDGRRSLQEAVAAHRDNGNAYELALGVEYRDQHVAGTGLCVDDLVVHRFQEELARSGAASFGWASWMDAGTADAVLRRFMTYDHAQRAVIGAWEHGGRYNASPYRTADSPPNPSLPEQWAEIVRFLDAYLKDVDNGVRSEKVLVYYTMGQEAWKQTSVWPPPGAETQRWYLSEGGELALTRPVTGSGADTYTVDWQASSGALNRWWEMSGIMGKSVTYSQRAEASSNLLTYTSPPLPDDLEITGHAVITLYVTSTESDGVFYVYLEDVDESGQVTYVTEGQLRAIHRRVSTEPAPYKTPLPYHSFKQQDAQPLVPGEVAELTFGLLPTSVLVHKGHRLRVGIAGHDAGTFVRIPAEGTPVIAVGRNSVHASYIDLPIVNA
jgi:putative CocE/NonD family hydrolase